MGESTTAVEVPLIDISGWDSGPHAQARIAARVGAAAADPGFMRVVGHGIPGQIHDGVREAIDLFFDRPAAGKLRYAPPEPDSERGYRAPAAPGAAETFRIGTQARDFPDRALPVDIYPANIWPVGLPKFQPQVMAWFDAAQRLARRLTRVFAVALDVPEGFFEPYTGHSIDVLRLEHRPPAPAGTAPAAASGEEAAGYTEPGLLRVVWAEGAPLQFADDLGRWREVAPWPDALVVHVGDLLARWTNDRWLAPPFRAVRPPAPAGRTGQRWRAAALSHGADFDALVTTLPTCVGPDRPDYYEPVTVARHMAVKLGGRWQRLITGARGGRDPREG
ncbi:isopenicillin N synthase family oxygenase [Streptomonospora nanhaiensis]|uniref:Isopenicillin N synthase-like dioxygenase n=1 Tax=Streptomonospora nanhaiensis TaxID=1323731 RepID=A0A853BJY7_9ACTN|nr:isopenicillin N synthase family oxygenase [Streptomonospora nanhaiensis]MBV2362321.1 isopenicillin N synthase family oxygenase [Streptomonospora nanhaiensis]NYI95024.1 isopenicillin N synthase-like dioxygenase [Streptomonospora nanhaiensis]